jgi:hypothetical protein
MARREPSGKVVENRRKMGAEKPDTCDALVTGVLANKVECENG